MTTIILNPDTPTTLDRIVTSQAFYRGVARQACRRAQDLADRVRTLEAQLAERGPAVERFRLSDRVENLRLKALIATLGPEGERLLTEARGHGFIGRAAILWLAGNAEVEDGR